MHVSCDVFVLVFVKSQAMPTWHCCLCVSFVKKLGLHQFQYWYRTDILPFSQNIIIGHYIVLSP